MAWHGIGIALRRDDERQMKHERTKRTYLKSSIYTKADGFYWWWWDHYLGGEREGVTRGCVVVLRYHFLMLNGKAYSGFFFFFSSLRYKDVVGGG